MSAARTCANGACGGFKVCPQHTIVPTTNMQMPRTCRAVTKRTPCMVGKSIVRKHVQPQLGPLWAALNRLKDILACASKTLMLLMVCSHTRAVSHDQRRTYLVSEAPHTAVQCVQECPSTPTAAVLCMVHSSGTAMQQAAIMCMLAC